jgi:2-keto-4-pentenoate hydratase/2-oxohepta-3-ene-1,7-dioic acid hydratase in catechol pathway
MFDRDRDGRQGHPGTIIATGAPGRHRLGMDRAGRALPKRSPGRYLSSGDILRLDIEAVGCLEDRRLALEPAHHAEG